MSKQQILKKLDLTERGAGVILANKDLCERILGETPIHTLEFADKHNLEQGYVYRLVKQNIISSFTNNPKRGAKVFVFEEEALNIIGKSISYTALCGLKTGSLRLIIPFFEKMYRGMEYQVILKMLVQKQPIEDVADEYGLTKPRIRQIYNKALKRTERYIRNLQEFDDVQKKLTEKSLELENLKFFISNTQKDFNVEDEDIKKISILNNKLRDYDLSVRALTCLYYGDVHTVGELVRLDRKDLLRFRNFGKKTLKELDDLVDSLGLEFGMKNLPDYSLVNHFVQFMSERGLNIDNKLIEEFKLTL